MEWADGRVYEGLWHNDKPKKPKLNAGEGEGVSGTAEMRDVCVKSVIQATSCWLLVRLCARVT